MISSLFNKVFWFTIFMAYSITGMERSHSDFLSAPKNQNPSPIPQSQSMALPKPKTNNSQEGSLRGSLIKAMGGIGRTTSSLFMGRSSSSGEVTPASVPAAAQIIATKLENPQIEKFPLQKKELIYNKPLYTIFYNEGPIQVRIEGSCLAQYRVASLKELKRDSGYLCRPEIINFINRVLAPKGRMIRMFNNIEPIDKRTISKDAYHYLKKYKNHPAFNTTVYVALLPEGGRICVFESDLTEISK